MTIVDKTLFQPTPTFRARRKRVLARVTVNGAETSENAMVRDISATGMSATALARAPAVDEMVSVTLADGSVLWGLVRWAEGKNFGVEFDPSSRESPAAGRIAG
jgi:hypothetical protein